MEVNQKIIFNKLKESNKKNLNLKIISIDGITCSGKSVYAKLLKKIINKKYKNVFILSKDLFLISREKRIRVTKNLSKNFNFDQNQLHYDKTKINQFFKVAKQKKINKKIKFKNLYNRLNGKNDKKITFSFNNKTIIIFEGLYTLLDLKNIVPIHKILITDTIYSSLARKIERIRDKKISIQNVVTEFTKMHLTSFRRYLNKYNFDECYSGEKTKFTSDKMGKKKQIKLINDFCKKHLF